MCVCVCVYIQCPRSGPPGCLMAGGATHLCSKPELAGQSLLQHVIGKLDPEIATCPPQRYHFIHDLLYIV